MVIGVDTLLDHDTKHQSEQFCEEATIPVLTSLVQKYLKTIPENEEKKLFYFARYSTPLLNAQSLLRTN